ncbi:MAG: inositol monophosphatase, partial [Calditrichaeota bacterium]
MMAKKVPDSFWVTQLRQIHRHIRERVLAELRGSQAQQMAEVVAESHADVIFAIDRIADEAVQWGFENFLGRDLSFILISEGLPGEGKRAFPVGTDFQSAEYCVIVDPIDGTRPLMFDKRSGWILTAVAANRGPATGLQDIFFAIQTEIPFSRQDWADCLWAFKGQPARAMRENLLTGEEIAYTPRASKAQTLD